MREGSLSGPEPRRIDLSGGAQKGIIAQVGGIVARVGDGAQGKPESNG